ncbi:hypothetical protein Leryth_003207 [Lithospermum erythrorhizon]|nr:hypothetical protein Leryth_003207 [Lithospermum erythrorhizon]
MEGKKLELFEVGPCENSYHIGFLIGQRFSNQISSRMSTDNILKDQLIPFVQTQEGQTLLQALKETNQKKYPDYWNELLGTAEGSGVPFLEILLVNFRKEIIPFIPKIGTNFKEEINDDCSDILVVNDTMAVAAHNEDGNVALIGHSYLIRGHLSNGVSYTAYTYAGELPSCAFGFNSHGLAFTLNSVPPSVDEIEPGGVGRNFISRDLLEAESINDAMSRIQSSAVSVGHSYNLIDIRTRRILNVETASRNRSSVLEIGDVPLFHANMYLHLQVQQANDENSLRRQKKASSLPKKSKGDFLALLGDMNDREYPIYMTGPVLYTLCTAVLDMDEQTLSITEGNPKEHEASYVLSMV